MFSSCITFWRILHIFLTDETQIEFTRWMETFNKSLPSAVKRRKELSPFIYIRNNIDNSQHKGEVHEVFEALKIAIESSHSMYYFQLLYLYYLRLLIPFHNENKSWIMYTLCVDVIVTLRPCYYYRMDLMGGINSTMTSLSLVEEM